MAFPESDLNGYAGMDDPPEPQPRTNNMETYIVKLRRMMEWEQIYEAPSADVAADLARLEAHHGTITDEWMDVGLVEALDAGQVD